MKLLKSNMNLIQAVVMVNGVQSVELSLPDYGSLTGFKAVSLRVMTGSATALTAIAATITGWGWGITADDLSASTDLLYQTGLLTAYAYVTNCAIGQVLPFAMRTDTPVEHDPVIGFNFVQSAENITLGPQPLVVNLVYDVYQLTQSEYIEALG